jgi:hypothetical protein
VSPVRYELGFYIPEDDDTLHSDRGEHLISDALYYLHIQDRKLSELSNQKY